MLALAPQAHAHPSLQGPDVPVSIEVRERERERERTRAASRSRPAHQVQFSAPARPIVTAPAPANPPAAPVHPAAPPPAPAPTQTPRTPHLPPPLPRSSSSNAVDVNSLPSNELLRWLASLLHQIAAANDALRQSSPSVPPSPAVESPVWHTLTSASRAALSTPSSPLSFHARNIPTISLEQYLLRILKYCPATNEVFLSLLVYFDRMSKLAAQVAGHTHSRTTFAIDSYNVHRLVIAGVTVASKFFSDVFYTNSRYAKVGGLPQTELNQLELQFLLLNDFRLSISCEEMQRYAEQLVLYSEHQTLGSTSIPPLPPAPTPAELTYPTPPAEPQPPTPTDSESEAGAETDAETDDEPTIRPSHSSAASEASELTSASAIFSEASEDDRWTDEQPPWTPSPGLSRQTSFTSERAA